MLLNRPQRARRTRRMGTTLLLVALAACGREATSRDTAGSDTAAATATARDTMPRAVALTFDDLPGVFFGAESFDVATAANERLLETLTRAGVHATGFVNEDKLIGNGNRVGVLEAWLDAGMDLGNHTLSHPDLHDTPLEEYQTEVLRGEVATRELMAERGLEPRWFRHPFLHTGRSLETRIAFEAFLDEHGYAVAPVTIDNYDYVFARAYDRALNAGESALAARIGDEYIVYMDTVFGFWEAQSRTIFEREPAQVLLLHVNRLNADRMDELLEMMTMRGYAVVPLDSAMRDPIYESEDRYDGPAGISWLHRWAITRGTPGSTFAGEPEVPDWVSARATRS